MQTLALRLRAEHRSRAPIPSPCTHYDNYIFNRGGKGDSPPLVIYSLRCIFPRILKLRADARNTGMPPPPAAEEEEEKEEERAWTYSANHCLG